VKDLDVDDRVLAEEQELDPQRSKVDALESDEGREDVAVDRRAREVTHFQAVAMRVAAIFEGKDLGDDLEKTAPELTEGERLALELLAECVSGRDARTHRIVYAERRLEMLELALATLQPAFALALVPELGNELRGAYDQLVEEVGDLRDKLDRLGDAQEELMAYRFDHEEEAGKPDEEDKPADATPTPAPSEPEKKPGLLGRIFGGGKKKEEPTPAAAPEVPAEDAPRESSLYGKPGDQAVEKPAAKSTVYDPD
jgi:hypothetical protein